MNDTIQVHLLVETALGDAKEYELLSQEEVDELKKQCQVLTQRIDQTKQNLVIQSKYRDAAISMARLYSPTSESKKSIDGEENRPRSHTLFGHKRGESDQLREAELERLASEKKCEDLALTLWSLEKRLMEPQSRLLKHTAGILQMTHKGPKKAPRVQSGPQNGMPGSPESMYTYTNARSSMEPTNDELLFDERSLYRSADHLDGVGEFGGPVGQREDIPPVPPSKAPSREQMQMISKTEQKLEDLNKRLREVIVKINPERQATYGMPPISRTTNDGRLPETGGAMQSHLEYLERGIITIDREQSQAPKSDPKSSQQLDETTQQLKEISLRLEESAQREEELSQKLANSEASMEETLGDLNHEVRDILLPYNPRPEPPQVTGNGLDDQLAYFQDSIKSIEIELSRASNASTKNAGTSENLERMETVMMGLWDIIQSGEEESRQAKLEGRQARAAQNLPEDDDMSPNEEGASNEPFSLQGFSAKVQLLYSQATKLKDQKQVLQRQIKQQRDLNNKTDAQKDAEFAQKAEELARTTELLNRTEADADAVREQLTVVMEKLDQMKQAEQQKDQQRSGDESSAVHAVQAELDEKNKTIASLEGELAEKEQVMASVEEELQELKDDEALSKAELKSKVSDYDAKIAALSAELETVTAALATFEASVKEKEKEIAAKEEEMDGMNMKLAELQTEVTIARAELDGAYGSKAQRAAEVAANPAIQKEINDLAKKNTSLAAELESLKKQPKVDPAVEENMVMLKKELEETIGEFEVMTKASIDWEKERERLEGLVDKLRDEREGLETQLSDEKVKWMGMRSPGIDASGDPMTVGGVGSTSTTVLKNEFKKMMRDTRAENAKALRVSSFSLLACFYFLLYLAQRY